MIDRKEKLWLIAMAVIIIMVLPVVFWFNTKVEGKSDRCTEQGGVMVKTQYGWRCIDSKVLM